MTYLVTWALCVAAGMVGWFLGTRIIGAPDREEDPCKLVEGYNGEWTCSECGESFEFEVDGPRENHYRYCSFCGRRVDDLLPFKLEDEPEFRG